MTLREFIRENRDDIDATIKRDCPQIKLSDAERRLWVLNNEGLYQWARSAGVRI